MATPAVETSQPLAAASGAIAETTTVASSRLQIGYFIAPARAWYEFSGSNLAWKDPAGTETNHVGIVVQQGSRTVPYCKVSVSLTSGTKDVVSTTTLSPTWSQEYFYYGGNVAVPATSDTLALHVRVEPGELRRLDKAEGAFFTSAVSCSFENVKITERSTTPKSGQAKEPEKGMILEGRHPAVTPTPYPGEQP